MDSKQLLKDFQDKFPQIKFGMIEEERETTIYVNDWDFYDSKEFEEFLGSLNLSFDDYMSLNVAPFETYSPF